MPAITLYRSSAGSGKTTVLAREYIRLALLSGFQHVLAVTFTNKATYELKERVIQRLHEYGNGQMDHQAEWLMKEMNLDREDFAALAKNLQREILHQYGSFSISTIDKFFQRVVRGFSREMGLEGNFNLEVDSAPVIRGAVDRLIGEAGAGAQLTEWLLQFALENAEKGKRVQLGKPLSDMAGELLKENFKVIRSELLEGFSAEKRDALKERLMEMVGGYYRTVREIGKQGLSIMREFDLDVADFKYGLRGGIGSFFQKLANLGPGVNEFQAKRAEKAASDDNAEWAKSGSEREGDILAAADAGLRSLLSDYISLRDRMRFDKQTAEAILQHYNTFGIISELLKKIEEEKKETDTVLLSDTQEFLNRIIADNDSPFIYEKTGSRFFHYLIDEFQDTSRLQWSNFRPLIENAVAYGKENLLVGDVKQSIYRWRGGDLELINGAVKREFPQTEIRSLGTNYRSSAEVVRFNNDLFERLIPLIRDKFISVAEDQQDRDELERAAGIANLTYGDVRQELPATAGESGYVEVSFLPGRKVEEYSVEALQKMTETIEELQKTGYEASDIAILVRKGDEARAIAQHLMKYRQSAEVQPDVNYSVMANEALQIGSSAAVHCVVAALRWMNDAGDRVSLFTFITDLKDLEDVDDWDRLLMSLRDEAGEGVTAKFERELKTLNSLGVYEAVEGIINRFGLHEYSEEIPYLLAFQDRVLEFVSRNSSDIPTFLTWWDEGGKNKEISSSEGSDAMNLLTVHKAKGLEFSAVIIPFCHWDIEKSGDPIWAGSDSEKFNEFPWYFVNYKKDLLHSHFRQSYLRERQYQFIDNLNILYVACTRASDALFIQIPVEKKNHIGELVTKVVRDGEQDTLQRGRLQTPDKESGKGEEGESTTVKWEGATGWRSRVRLSHRELMRLDASVYERVERGEIFHEILSRPEAFTDDCETMLDRYVKEGKLTTEQKAEIADAIGAIRAHPVYDYWKASGVREYSEPTIVSPEGVRRPDKVLEAEDRLTVFDFKSGEPAESHKRQIREYMELIQQMEKKKVEGYLIYLQPFEVVLV